MLKHKCKAFGIILSIGLIVAQTLFPALTFAAPMSEAQQLLLESGSLYHNLNCSDNSGSSGGTGTSVLDGVSLPVTHGGTGSESQYNDMPSDVGDGGKYGLFTSVANGKSGDWKKYWVNMRWEYVSANWSATNKFEDSNGKKGDLAIQSWLDAQPRFMVITNPENGKSVRAIVGDYGPGPSAGSVERGGSKTPGSGPSYWTNSDYWFDSDITLRHPEYSGRVSGLSESAINALKGGDSNYIQWEYGGPDNGGRGVDLQYAWSSDQESAPGPTSERASDNTVGGTPIDSVKGNQITWIGDSISNGARPVIEKEFSGVSIADYEALVKNKGQQVQGSKLVSKDNDKDAGGSSGLTIAKKLSREGKLRDVVVFALGTNGGVTEKDVEKLIEITGTDRRIVMMTLKGANEDSNELIRSLPAKYSNIYIADWNSIADDAWLAADSQKIHPNAAGQKAFAEMFYNAIGSASSSFAAAVDICTCPAPGAGGGGGKTVFLSPGHGATIKKEYAASGEVKGLYGGLSLSEEEAGDVLDVANMVKTNLVNYGYNVVMAWETIGSAPNNWQRGNMAEAANADIGVSIHTTYGASSWHIAGQKVGNTRTNTGNGEVFTFKNAETAALSQGYSEIFKNARGNEKKNPIVNHDYPGSFGSERDLGTTGNIAIEALAAPNVPWVYNEIERDNGKWHIEDTTKEVYATGITNGITQSLSGVSAANNPWCEPAGEGDVVEAAAGVIDLANQYGSTYCMNTPGGRGYPCPSGHNTENYINKFMDGELTTGRYWTVDCTGFVATVMYKAFGFWDHRPSANLINGGGNYQEVDDSEVQPGDVFVHRGHAGIVIEVEDGKITKTAETGGMEGMSGNNDNVGYKSGDRTSGQIGENGNKYLRWTGGSK
jgi:N-acetylmuramoyl-L-alanine amidase